MKLKELQRNWHKFGKEDPLWAILTVPEKRENKWRLDEFFETGRTEIGAVLADTAALGLRIQKKKALDFGCGVGRLTQAMASHFDEVAGVDIARSMLKLARQYNRVGDRCRYYLNEADDLRLFEDRSFDFIYTNMVLQHMRQSYAKAYIAEFLRVLKPGGVAVFQVAGGELPWPTPPSQPAQPQQTRGTVRRIKNIIKFFIPKPLHEWYLRMRYGPPLGIWKYLNARYGEPMMEMYVLTKEEIEPVVKKNGGRIVNMRQDNDAGEYWISHRYIVQKG